MIGWMDVLGFKAYHPQWIIQHQIQFIHIYDMYNLKTNSLWIASLDQQSSLSGKTWTNQFQALSVCSIGVGSSLFF